MNKFNKKDIPLYIGVVVWLIFILMAFLPDVFTNYTPNQMFAPWQKVSLTHFLGTNDIGNDIFTQLVYGTKNTLVIGVFSAVISTAVGVAFGIISGYTTGILPKITDVFINAFMIIPMLPLAILIVAFWGGGIYNNIITISLVSWCGVARAVRGKTMSLKHAGFCESLIILGIPNRKIVLRHIIPNLRQVILAAFLSALSSAMLTEATLSFLGFSGGDKTTWGAIINTAYKLGGFSRGAVNWFVPPGIAIAICVLSLYIINNRLEQKEEEIVSFKE